MRPGVLYYLVHLLRDLLHGSVWSHSVLVQCLSSSLIPLLLFASQTCLVQHNCLIQYALKRERQPHTSNKGSGGSGNSVMTEERNEPMVWDEFYKGAGEIAADCGMEPIMLRLCVAQRHRINVPGDRNPQACSISGDLPDSSRWVANHGSTVKLLALMSQ